MIFGINRILITLLAEDMAEINKRCLFDTVTGYKQYVRHVKLMLYFEKSK